MKVAHLISLATLASAIVVPDEQMVEELAAHDVEHAWDHLPSTSELLDSVKDVFHDIADEAEHAFDAAIDTVTRHSSKAFNALEGPAWDVHSWLGAGSLDVFGGLFEAPSPEDGPPEHGKKPKKPKKPKHPPPPPPHHGPPPPPPHHGPPHPPPPHHGPPHHDPPHHGPPHHGPPHHHSNKTLWELISSSKYTTKLASFLKNDTELVKALNGSSHNFTVFAPIDKAFPEHIPIDKIPAHFIHKALSYHVVPAFYPAARIFGAHTLETLSKETALGGPQRLSVGLGLHGLAVNHYSKIIAVNIFGSNGVIHGVDHVLIPPPPALAILNYLPGEFSTLTLGLTKTGLLKTLNESAHVGSTIFAPDNFAFKKLGPKINGFLFSKHGEKYLKALLEYHVVYNHTLYSNAYYDSTLDSKDENSVVNFDERRVTTGPTFHFDLPTLLGDRYLSVDVARFGPFAEIKINGFSRVKVQDGIAKDGVIQAVGSVLIPPRKGTTGADGQWRGEEMSVEEFKERLEPFVAAKETEEMFHVQLDL